MSLYMFDKVRGGVPSGCPSCPKFWGFAHFGRGGRTLDGNEVTLCEGGEGRSGAEFDGLPLNIYDKLRGGCWGGGGMFYWALGVGGWRGKRGGKDSSLRLRRGGGG